MLIANRLQDKKFWEELITYFLWYDMDGIEIQNIKSGGGGVTHTYLTKGYRPHRHLWVDCLENVGASTSHNPMGLHDLLQW
jgi:hypothetical protein